MGTALDSLTRRERLKKGYPLKGQEEVSASTPKTTGKLSRRSSAPKSERMNMDSSNLNESARLRKALGITRGYSSIE